MLFDIFVRYPVSFFFLCILLVQQYIDMRATGIGVVVSRLDFCTIIMPCSQRARKVLRRHCKNMQPWPFAGYVFVNHRCKEVCDAVANDAIDPQRVTDICPMLVETWASDLQFALAKHVVVDNFATVKTPY